MEQDNDNLKLFGSCLLVIFIIAMAIWGAKGLYDKWHSAEKKPFWQGTSAVQVCKTPYYSSKECYKLNVTLFNDNKSAKINFNNKGYIYVEDVTCYFAGRWSSDDPKYTFCQSVDKNNERWDFLPIWVNYY